MERKGLYIQFFFLQVDFKVSLFGFLYLLSSCSLSPKQSMTFNYEKIKKWTKTVPLFEKEYIFIPIHERYILFVL